MIADAVFELNRLMDVNRMQSFQRCKFLTAFVPNNTGLGFTFKFFKR